jgi:hypothetical protein
LYWFIFSVLYNFLLCRRGVVGDVWQAVSCNPTAIHQQMTHKEEANVEHRRI